MYFIYRLLNFFLIPFIYSLFFILIVQPYSHFQCCYNTVVVRTQCLALLRYLLFSLSIWSYNPFTCSFIYLVYQSRLSPLSHSPPNLQCNQATIYKINFVHSVFLNSLLFNVACKANQLSFVEQFFCPLFWLYAHVNLVIFFHNWFFKHLFNDTCERYVPPVFYIHI